MSNTYGDLVADALSKIRVGRGGDTPAPDDMALCLRALNRRIDSWNADRPKVFREFFQDFTLTANHTPHTIGVSASAPDFTVTGNRPVSIERAALSIGGSPASYQRIEVYDYRFYAGRAQPGLTSSLPFALYYDPAYDTTTPVGNCYFWPVPSSALGVRLWMRQVLVAVLQTDLVVLPPGYELALLLTTAEDVAEDFGQQVTPKLEREAGLARAVIEANNRFAPYLATADSGMPSTDSGGGMTKTDFLSRGPF